MFQSLFIDIFLMYSQYFLFLSTWPSSSIILSCISLLILSLIFLLSYRERDMLCFSDCILALRQFALYAFFWLMMLIRSFCIYLYWIVFQNFSFSASFSMVYEVQIRACFNNFLQITACSLYALILCQKPSFKFCLYFFSNIFRFPSNLSNLSLRSLDSMDLQLFVFGLLSQMSGSSKDESLLIGLLLEFLTIIRIGILSFIAIYLLSNVKQFIINSQDIRHNHYNFWMQIQKKEEIIARNLNKNKQQQVVPSQFKVFCDEKQYIYMKFFPHLDTIERSAKMLHDFEQIKTKQFKSKQV